ncbi:MAG TPA: TonB-dependent receptor, partial [Luteimonas sp.]|nr:TonB-dependent receptor [Luteimonas sp.]
MLPQRSALATALGAALLLSAHAHARVGADAPTTAATEAGAEGASDAEAKPQQLDSIVITATRGSKAIDKIPGAISVVTREELDDQLLATEDLSHVLATQVPGYAPTRQ